MVNNAKEVLYERIDKMRKNLGITSYDTTINTLELCTKKLLDVDVVYHTFDTTGFCGAAFAGEKINTIILNSARSEIEQNFDCGHELIHLVRHRKINCGIFNCVAKNQNSFLEWEANEGSAQLLVPFQDFIPRFTALLRLNVAGIPNILAKHYHVTPQVINIRLDSLAYEIDQYQNGTSLDCLELLSRRQRNQRGITPTCYNAICDPELGLDSATSAFYNRLTDREISKKHENMADKWAIKNLVPKDELEKAVESGCTEIYSLAEHFGVTEEFMRKAVCLYTYGIAVELYL